MLTQHLYHFLLAEAIAHRVENFLLTFTQFYFTDYYFTMAAILNAAQVAALELPGDRGLRCCLRPDETRCGYEKPAS